MAVDVEVVDTVAAAMEAVEMEAEEDMEVAGMEVDMVVAVEAVDMEVVDTAVVDTKPLVHCYYFETHTLSHLYPFGPSLKTQLRTCLQRTCSTLSRPSLKLMTRVRS